LSVRTIPSPDSAGRQECLREAHACPRYEDVGKMMFGIPSTYFVLEL
jgi:hypothetical protein